MVVFTFDFGNSAFITAINFYDLKRDELLFSVKWTLIRLCESSKTCINILVSGTIGMVNSLLIHQNLRYTIRIVQLDFFQTASHN